MACTDDAITSLTVDDFKTLFFRGFSYNPYTAWDNSTTYNTDDVIYYPVDYCVYKCLNDGVTSLPTDTNDWEKQSDSALNYVLDMDITNAYTEACVNFNSNLFSDDEDKQTAYLYLAAHYVVNDFNAGGTNSSASHPVSSRSVGNVSEGYTIPESITKGISTSFLSTTKYGMKYLSLIKDRAVGAVYTVCGGTNP